jgi:hypothetical protein
LVVADADAVESPEAAPAAAAAAADVAAAFLTALARERNMTEPSLLLPVVMLVRSATCEERPDDRLKFKSIFNCMYTIQSGQKT